MKIFQRWRRRRSPYRAASDEEQIARYVYLLSTLPASVIESAHANAFRDVPAQKRREMFETLRPFMTESEKDAAADDPVVLARLLRRAEERKARRNGADDGAPSAVATLERGDAPRIDQGDVVDPLDIMRQNGMLYLVAYNFTTAAAVTSYFAYGAGSIGLADQPPWIGDMVDPGSAGYGGGDYGGGGFDGGGFGGGFDGGGFGGGGFDGGGGF